MSLKQYSCFRCGVSSDVRVSLGDECPNCGTKYSYPIDNQPTEIVGDKTYRITGHVGRGFYAAAFKCIEKDYVFSGEYILKVTPLNVIDYYKRGFENDCKKHFENDCKKHFDLTKNNCRHIVRFIRHFYSKINFGSDEIECAVVLEEFVDGYTLEKYIESDDITSNDCLQISISLLEMRDEWALNNTHHNDLHAGNIIVKRTDYSEPDTGSNAMAVAIDINSAAYRNRENAGYVRDDLEFIGYHIRDMAVALNKRVRERGSDFDKRVVDALLDVSDRLDHQEDLEDQESAGTLIRYIKNRIRREILYSPWKYEPDILFGDMINAQLIDSSYINMLFVDGNEWFKSISKLQPQLITGMRGCGKTMLLYSLDIHARLPKYSNTIKGSAIDGVLIDGFIGIKATCKIFGRLVEAEFDKKMSLLFWQYCVEAVRMAIHIQDLQGLQELNSDPINVESVIYSIESVLSSVLDYNTKEKFPDLISFANFLTKEESTHFKKSSMISGEVSWAFCQLASAIRSFMGGFSNHNIFFLLDDASSRYLSKDDLEKLLVYLKFMDPRCCFKITTELQSLLLLNANNESVFWNGRDYGVFDLGMEVLELLITENKKGCFIEKVLDKRASALGNPDHKGCAQRLGHQKLVNIARNIIKSELPKKDANFPIYWGIEALNNLCVGDIGDIIHIYDMMIKEKPITSKKLLQLDLEGTSAPLVKKEIQHNCYIKFSSNRVYSVRDGRDYLIVKSFAEASHSLLVKSSIASPRQYCNLHLTLDSGFEGQFKEIMTLIDRGLFVLSLGNNEIRGKKGMQIKLRFRKAYGLAYKIGLGNNDRFELNGTQIEEWLKNPQSMTLEKSVKKISDNLDISLDDSEISLDDSVSDLTSNNVPTNEKREAREDTVNVSGRNSIPNQSQRLIIESINKPNHIGTLVVSNGFEPRALESFRFLVNSLELDRIIFTKYKSVRYDEEYDKILGKCKCEVKRVTMDVENIIEAIDSNYGTVLVDITGLQKSLIYPIVKHCTIHLENFYVAYTRAERYMPTSEEVDILLNKLNGAEAEKIEALRSVPGGDLSGYVEERLEPSIGDTSNRPVVLISPVSVKIGRVQELLENNEFDDVKLIVINGEENHRLFEMKVAQYIQAGCNNSEIITVSEDPNDLINKFVDVFNKNNRGSSIVVSLTGTKIQAMVFAALSSVYNIEQCIYERPVNYDLGCSTGWGETLFFFVSNNMAKR